MSLSRSSDLKLFRVWWCEYQNTRDGIIKSDSVRPSVALAQSQEEAIRLVISGSKRVVKSVDVIPSDFPRIISM